MIRKFWLVWNESGQFPRYKHDTEQSARTEAERLTRNVGGKFHVLELIGTCERKDVEWHTPVTESQAVTRTVGSPELSDLVNREYDDSDPFAEE